MSVPFNNIISKIQKKVTFANAQQTEQKDDDSDGSYASSESSGFPPYDPRDYEDKTDLELQALRDDAREKLKQTPSPRMDDIVPSGATRPQRPNTLSALGPHNVAENNIPVPDTSRNTPPSLRAPVASRGADLEDQEAGEILTQIGTIKDEWQASTGASCHVTNDLRWFTADTFRAGNMRPIKTGGGVVYPAGYGTVHLKVIVSKGVKHTLRLPKVYFIPTYPTNIFALSSIYRLDVGGWLAKETIFLKGKPVGNVKITRKGMFLDLADKKVDCPQ